MTDEPKKHVFPMRTCKACDAKTTSTSTINHCVKCDAPEGLHPPHFLTATKTGGPST